MPAYPVTRFSSEKPFYARRKPGKYAPKEVPLGCAPKEVPLGCARNSPFGEFTGQVILQPIFFESGRLLGPIGLWKSYKCLTRPKKVGGLSQPQVFAVACAARHSPNK